MKKNIVISLILVLAMALSLLAGCGSKQDSAEKPKDTGKISISLYAYDRSMFKELTPWLEEKFPEIDFTQADAILNRRRTESLAYLTENLRKK